MAAEGKYAYTAHHAMFFFYNFQSKQIFRFFLFSKIVFDPTIYHRTTTKSTFLCIFRNEMKPVQTTTNRFSFEILPFQEQSQIIYKASFTSWTAPLTAGEYRIGHFKLPKTLAPYPKRKVLTIQYILHGRQITF